MFCNWNVESIQLKLTSCLKLSVWSCAGVRGRMLLIFFGDDPQEVEDDLRGRIFFVANCHMATSQLVFLILGGIWWKCGGFRNSRTPQTKSTSCVKCMMYCCLCFGGYPTWGTTYFGLLPWYLAVTVVKILCVIPSMSLVMTFAKPSPLFDSEKGTNLLVEEPRSTPVFSKIWCRTPSPSRISYVQ